MGVFDVFIVGSGAAGLSAGMYAARYQLKTIVVGKELGGETTTAWTIENYPGFTAIDGFDLVQKMKEQTEANGVQVQGGDVTAIRQDGGCFTLESSLGRYQAKSIILANGTLRRHLNLPKEQELTGKGIHYCATCDAPLYKDRVIAIVGGGDASIKGANLAKRYSSKIYLIVRGDKLSGEPANLAALKGAPNVAVLYETSVAAIVGDQKLEKIILSKEYQGSNELVIDGLFIEIGADPNNELAKQLGCELDEKSYVKVDNLMKTNVPGIFGAGDSTNFFGSFKQVITAAAQGAVAATSAYQYVQTNPMTCSLHAKPVPISS
ncbi:FAD-dependent oxidoreductase [Candidatus Berkelbacteria bacterium]|nr:FAD-dependent oxidoreductase [Candidatus Berkelbacteria bacterium]